MMKEKRYFQWIDGEDVGTVEILVNIRYEKGEYFFEFQSGESMNMRFIAQETNDPNMLRGMAMVEIRDPHDKWRIKESRSRFETVNTPDRGEVRVEIPSYDVYTMAEQTGDGTLTSKGGNNKQYIAPNFRGPFRPLPNPEDFYEVPNKVETLSKPVEKTSPKLVQYDVTTDSKPMEYKPVVTKTPTAQTLVESTPVSVADRKEQPSVLNQSRKSLSPTDPVYILVNSSAKEEKAIDLTLRLNLPSKDLYRLVSMQFDNGSEKFMQCITDIISESLRGEDIVKSLTESIKAAYMSE